MLSDPISLQGYRASHRESLDGEDGGAAAEHAELQSQLAALQAELAQAIEANEKAKAETQALIEKHQGELAEAEKLRQEIEAKLNEEIARITADLEVRLDCSSLPL